MIKTVAAPQKAALPVGIVLCIKPRRALSTEAVQSARLKKQFGESIEVRDRGRKYVWDFDN